MRPLRRRRLAPMCRWMLPLLNLRFWRRILPLDAREFRRPSNEFRWPSKPPRCLRTNFVGLASADSEFRNRYELQPLSPAASQPVRSSSPQDLEDATSNPTEGWPRYDILSPSGNPNLAPPNPFTSTTFAGVSPPEASVRDGEDPMAVVQRANVSLAG